MIEQGKSMTQSKKNLFKRLDSAAIDYDDGNMLNEL